MQTRIVTVSPHDPLRAVQRTFVEQGIHGAPVVDEEGRVLGVITSMDLLRVHRVLVIEGGELRGIVSALDLVALLESRG